MPFKGDFDKLRKLTRSVERLADPNGRPQQRIAREVIREVRAGPLRDQYQTGVGPDGPWQPRKDGKPALVSRKLPTVIRGRPIVGGAQFEWRSKIMQAHHEGHVFPARRGGGHSVFFDESNRAIRMGRLTRRAFRYSFVREVVVGAHAIRARRFRVFWHLRRNAATRIARSSANKRQTPPGLGTQADHISGTHPGRRLPAQYLAGLWQEALGRVFQERLRLNPGAEALMAGLEVIRDTDLRSH